MKKLIFMVLLLVSTIAFGQSQDTTYWKHTFKGSLSFNQAAFSQNWSAGGVNSVGLNALINYKANYLKAKHSWDNEADMLYGFVNNDGQGYRKNNDRIYLDTKYGLKISPKWNLYGSMNVLTQFAEGFRYDKDSLDREVPVKISDFMAPGFITAALGFEYVPKPFFKLRLSPIAPRLTVVTDKNLPENVSNNYGVAVGSTTRWEALAATLLADFDKDLNKNINLKFRYLMYANYQTLELEKIDHRLDAIMSAKIAKYFDVKLSLILLYDYDQIDELQSSQALGIGFVYTFKNYESDK